MRSFTWFENTDYIVVGELITQFHKEALPSLMAFWSSPSNERSSLRLVSH